MKVKVSYQVSTEEENFNALKRQVAKMSREGPRTTISALADYLVCKGLREMQRRPEVEEQSEGAG